MKRVILIVSVFSILALVVTGFAQGNNKPPSAAAVDFAVRTSDLLLATLFAALTQEFDETTPDNVQEGIQSIGLVFNNENSNMRLVGTFQPLDRSNEPQDTFETAALLRAMSGQLTTNVERKGNTWFYRRSIPLSNFRSECALCHGNFPAGPTPDWMGALMLKIPIKD